MQVIKANSGIQSKKLPISIGLLVCFFLMTYLYSSSIAGTYAYLGYKYDFKVPQFLFCVSLFIILFYFQTRTKSFFCYYISVLLTLLFFIPNAILTIYDHGYYEIAFFSFLLTGIVLLIKEKSVKSFENTKKFEVKDETLMLLFYSTCGFILLYLVFFGIQINWSLLLLDEDVYEGRLKFGNQVASSVIFPYTYSLLTKFIIPIGIILSFKRKKWLLILIFSAFQLYLFMLNPHKTVIFIFLVVIVLSFIDIKKHLLYIIWGAVFIFLLTIQFNIDSIENMLLRRVLFVPAKLNQAYYEVFAETKLYLSYSILSPFVDYPLNESPAYFVSSNFYSNVASHSNNGILSSGYMNFGMMGVIGNILFFFYLIKYVKNTVFSKDLIVIFLPTIFLLNSSYLLTALLTHGLWFLLLFAYINKKI